MPKKITYTSSEAKTMNELARHQMIYKLLVDIRLDLTICEIEGWDKKEYIRMLRNEINRIKI